MNHQSEPAQVTQQRLQYASVATPSGCSNNVLIGARHKLRPAQLRCCACSSPSTPPCQAPLSHTRAWSAAPGAHAHSPQSIVFSDVNSAWGPIPKKDACAGRANTKTPHIIQGAQHMCSRGTSSSHIACITCSTFQACICKHTQCTSSWLISCHAILAGPT